MSPLSAVEASGVSRAAAAEVAARGSGPRQRLVVVSIRAGAGVPDPTLMGSGQPCSSSIRGDIGQLPLKLDPDRPKAGQAPVRGVMASRTRVARPGGSARPAPLRLTRRGRVVLSILVIAGVTAAVLLVSLIASGGAQATNHGQARGGYQGMREIVVQPGQTLWSIAATAEPSADIRVVVEQIMSVNALAGTNIHVGQLLWVPR